MTIASHQSQDRLKTMADVSSALACQIAELRELREAVRKAELAPARKKQACKKLAIRPGRLFMQTHWLMGRNYPLP